MTLLLVSSAISLVCGGIMLAVARRLSRPTSAVIGVIVLAAMSLWAWHVGHRAFPATFGPFVATLLIGASATRNNPNHVD